MKIEARESRMVIISDLHLGNPFSLAGRRLSSFLDFVRANEYSLCINGDGLEILQGSFTALATDVIEPLAQLRRLIADGHRVYYIVGNHDITLEHLLDTWLGEHICPFLNLWSGDQRIRIEHGHLYDPFFCRSPHIYELATRMAGPLLHVYPDVYYLWSWYQGAKAKVRGLVSRRDDHREPSVYLDAAEMLLHRGFDLVVFGHTHNPEVLRTPYGTYVNSGNWMRSSNYVVIDEGHVTLKRWHDDKLIESIEPARLTG